MTIEDLLVFGKKYCHSDHVKLLLADLLDLNPLELLNHLNDSVEEVKIKKFQQEIKSLSEGKPLQYVIGTVNFYGNQFIVNEKVLIPRFETEELVENTLKYLATWKKKKLKVLDIGCGSGVIGLTIKQKMPHCEVDLLDISKEALEVAKQNATNLGLEVNFIESDIFSKVKKKYDVIISNPPYIKETEEIEEIVKNNEPKIALYAGKDGLDIYRKILKDIKDYLEPNYLIAFEIGCTQKEELKRLINQSLEKQAVETKKDLSGKDRMIFITKNE